MINMLKKCGAKMINILPDIVVMLKKQSNGRRGVLEEGKVLVQYGYVYQ